MQHLKRLQDELTTICECHEMDTQAAQEMSDLMSHLIKNRGWCLWLNVFFSKIPVLEKHGCHPMILK